jgi:hypothetical protein
MITVNSEGCLEGRQCDFLTVNTWSEQAKPGADLECTGPEENQWFFSMLNDIFIDDFDDIAEEADELVELEIKERKKVMIDCGTRDLKAKYPGSSTLYRCNTDNDCKLMNGSFGYCTCGLDSFSYCRPTVDDPFFEEFWEKCSIDEGKIDQSLGQLWYWSTFLHVQLQSAPSCALDVFADLAFIKELAEEVSSGQTYSVALALIAFIV